MAAVVMQMSAISMLHMLLLECENLHFMKFENIHIFSADNCAVANGPDVECNGVCDIDPIDNRPVCNPTCDFNNGGCTDDEVCVEDRIFCVRAPCPQFLIRCENRRGE